MEWSPRSLPGPGTEPISGLASVKHRSPSTQVPALFSTCLHEHVTRVNERTNLLRVNSFGVGNVVNEALETRTETYAIFQFLVTHEAMERAFRKGTAPYIEKSLSLVPTKPIRHARCLCSTKRSPRAKDLQTRKSRTRNPLRLMGQELFQFTQAPAVFRKSMAWGLQMHVPLESDIAFDHPPRVRKIKSPGLHSGGIQSSYYRA